MLLYIDFSNTITLKDFNYYTNNTNNNIIFSKIDIFRLIGSEKRINLLKTFFSHCKYNNYQLNILSRNKEILIYNFLKQINLLKYFTNIIGFETLSKFKDKTKQKADFILHHHHILDPFKILVIDDSTKQILNIKQKCEWINCYKINNSNKGIDFFDILNIKTEIKNIINH